MMGFFMNRRVFHSAVFILSALTFLSANGGPNVNGADEQASMPLVEPCDLISKAEAEEVVGAALKEGQYSENKVVGQKICLYEAADSDSFAFLQLSLTQDAFIAPKVLASGQDTKAIFTSIKNAFPDREDISGIGDEAFIATPGIHILKGDYYLTVGMGNIKRNKAGLIEAGKMAVANLEAAL